MIYDLDEILKQKLTKDNECKKSYDNLKGLYETGVVELRYYGEERDIKLNMLERKEEPMKVRKGDFNYLYCPVCGNKFEAWVQLDPYCGKCGQRIQL
jgi:hypothetical protein